MKKLLIFAACAAAFLSCQKEDAIGIQKSSFPGLTEEIGKIELETIFNQTALNLKLETPQGLLGNKYANAFLKVGQIAKTTADNSAVVYWKRIPGEVKSLTPTANISIILEPDIDALSALAEKVGFGYGFSSFKGCALVAISDKGSVYAIDEFLEDDVLGTLNGLVQWMNAYVSTKDKIAASAQGSDLPDAETLFNSFESGYTFTFVMPEQEVEHIACSKKDYLDGNGTVDVLYKVTPLHAFDDQIGHGDYYVVTSSAAFNSAGMYKGHFTKKHGGVHVRICGSYAKEFTIQSYIGDKDEKPVGQFVAGAMPNPTTTIGSTSYSTGISWNLGASVTGGVTSGRATATATANTGVSVNNSTTRNISDLDILLDQKNNVATYTLQFNNLPHYKDPLKLTEPTEISTHTARLEHSYIVHLPDVKDNSTETHKMIVKITKLDYGACNFHSSKVDYHTHTWGLDRFNKTTTYKTGGMDIPLPNRIPTGKIVITHDDVKYGKYIFEIKATDVKDPQKVYTFDESSYAQGDSFTSYLPVGKYDFEMKVGDSATTTSVVKSNRPIEIKRGEDTKINTGADFEK